MLQPRMRIRKALQRACHYGIPEEERNVVVSRSGTRLLVRAYPCSDMFLVDVEGMRQYRSDVGANE